ncbi:MAG: aldo/keto reductase [Brevundimonas sp.]|uniref:aldo/keto reductase n=1 Tax=Brevundimonas sp. TaxID=1871086 RepID=UPI0024886A5D|nr:aldo/keto reductase [Brevundimonas sp.]MDI1325510.1 aldo/keto reductase [Brevundimonas sp.]
MELALGTVQFGVDYGIASARRADDATAAKILSAAWEMGIRRLDTAPGYGDIEPRLAGLCGSRNFSIVSKIPGTPAGLGDEGFVPWLVETVETSRRRLGDRLRGLIFHDAAMTLGERGRVARETLGSLLDDGEIELGASHYDGTTLLEPATWPDCRMAQLPGNALDQRILDQDAILRGLEVSLRSVFLQGLLLMEPSAAAKRLPAAAPAVEEWHAWCRRRNIQPLEAALAIAKGFSMVDFCLVGVDSEAQLRAIGEAWERATAITAPELASDDPSVIDPRTWLSA